MNSLERVCAVFAGRPVDRVPVYHVTFSSAVASQLLGREAYVGGGIQRWREVRALWQGEEAHREFEERSFQDAIAIARFCGHDIIRPGYWRYPVKPTRRIDEYTYLFECGPEEDWTVLRYDPDSEECTISPCRPRPALTEERLEALVQSQEAAAAAYRPRAESFDHLLRAQRLFGQEYVVRADAGGVSIPLEPLWLEAAITRPALVGRLLDAQAEIGVRNIEFLSSFGLRFFFGGGDMASSLSPLYSPRVFHDLVLPRLRRVAEACHRCGGYYLFASDGNLWPVADDLFGASGVDGYLEIDRLAGMDLERLRQRFPRLTLLGNVSSHTVHRGTPADVIAEARSCLEAARRYGGIIAGCSNALVHGSPIENVRALLETIEKYR